MNYRGIFAKTLYFFLIIFFAFSVDFCFAKKTEVNPVINIIGTSKIYEKNIARARENAVSQCLHMAVDRKVLEMAAVENVISGFQSYNQRFFSRAGEFISNYKVLTEHVYEDTFRILVEVTVHVKRLEKTLSESGYLGFAGKKQGRVLFLIAERNVGEIAPRYWWKQGMENFESNAEATMAEEFREKRFSVIDHSGGFSSTSVVGGNFEPYLDDDTALWFGRQFRADIVVVGSGIVDRSGNMMGDDVMTISGTITARALNTETGEEIGRTFQAATAMDADERESGRQALKSAGLMAGEELAAVIARNYRKTSSPEDKIEISATGANFFGNFITFRRKLSEMAGVNKIELNRMGSQGASILVDYDGAERELSRKILEIYFERFALNVVDVSPGLIRVEFVHKASSEYGTQFPEDRLSPDEQNEPRIRME